MNDRASWTGTCGACNGPSGAVVDGKRGPYRKSLRVSGTVVLESGKVLEIAEPVRVEVCQRCNTRWIRNGTFQSKNPPRLTTDQNDRIAKCLETGLTVAEIARACRVPYATAWKAAARAGRKSQKRSARSQPKKALASAS